MGGSAAAPMPYQQVTTTEEMPKWKKELLGFTPNAPEYSPFKALSRQAGTQAKIIEGMTSRPSWSAMYEAFGVPPGTDLTPYINATRTGQALPQAPIPASPAAGDIPAFIPPSEQVTKKKAAQGGLMSLRKGYADGGTTKAMTAQQQRYVKNISDAIQKGTVTQAQIDRINTIEKNTGLNVSPYSDVGTGTPKNKTIADLVGKTATTYQTQQADKAKQATDASAPSAVPLSQAMNVVTPFMTQAKHKVSMAASPTLSTSRLSISSVRQVRPQNSSVKQRASCHRLRIDSLEWRDILHSRLPHKT